MLDTIKQYATYDINSIDIHSHTYVDDIAKVFFLLDEDKISLISRDDVLQEIARRIGVFHKAFLESDNIYDVFKEAYTQGLYTVRTTKDDYKKLNAQGFIAYLLFGNSNKLAISRKEIVYIYERIQKLLQPINTPLSINIIQQISDLITAGYGSKEDNEKIIFDEDTAYEIHKSIRYSYNQSELPINHYELSVAVLSTYKDLFFDSLYTSYLGYKKDDDETNIFTRDEYMGLLEKEIAYRNVCEIIVQEEKILLDRITILLSEEMPGEAFDEDFRILLEKHISTYTLSYKFRSYDDEPTFEPLTIETMEHVSRYNKVLYTIHDNLQLYNSSLEEILKLYKIYRGLKKFDSNFGTADYEKIQYDKVTYGAKAAYTNALRILCDKMLSYRNDDTKERIMYLHEFSVPDYECIAIDQYIYWQQYNTLDDNYYKKIYDIRSAKNTPIIIRSSALYSEDNDTTTGAGMYDSLSLKAGFSYTDFCDTIIKIYESCNSSRALEYRKKNNIPEEYMGLLIQTYIDYGMNSHVNSIMPHRPELGEVYMDNGNIKPIIHKEHMRNFIFGDHEQDDIYFYNIDHRGSTYTMDLIRSSGYIFAITTMIERYFRHIIQTEFVIKDRDNARGEDFYVVQARPLPQSLQTKYHIEFLQNQQPIREGRALGVCDAEYDVLETGADNTDKEGVVVFSDNQYASLHEKFIEHSIPKKGVVIVKNAGGMDGHIETLCVEKGVVCLFPLSGSRDQSSMFDMSFMNHAFFGGSYTHRVKRKHKDFEGHTRIRIIADGLHGKIYSVEE